MLTPAFLSAASATQLNSGHTVEITYALTGLPDDLFDVTVAVSSDGGSTWTVSATSLLGDCGPGVAPGTARKIVWDAGADWPGHASAQMVVRLATKGAVALTPEFALDTRSAEISGFGAMLRRRT
jgi:hypothetical protein